jgi:hypothetical protein
MEHLLFIQNFEFTIMYSLNPKPISSSAQYVILQKYFSHPGLHTYFFPTPPIKLKLGLTARHPDQSNYLANQWQVLGFVVHFADPRHMF